MANLDAFKGTYPYASALFGIYQPLLGWRSRQASAGRCSRPGPSGCCASFTRGSLKPAQAPLSPPIQLATIPATLRPSVEAVNRGSLPRLRPGTEGQ